MSESYVLVSAVEAIADAVLSAAAALGPPVEVVSSAADGLERWAAAAGVLVGEDLAAGLASLGPRARPGVYLVGFSASELGRHSVPLGGQLIVLPEGPRALRAFLAAAGGSGARGGAVGGARGGVGASTLAAGLALAAAHGGGAAALVDADPLGGGIDLLLGAERAPGWRWPGLLGARGEVTDVRRFLPQVGGLSVVAMERPTPGGAAGPPPGAESVRAVLGSLARHHDLVVLDPGRSPLPSVRPALASCRRVVLLSGTAVRAVAAAESVLGTVEAPEVVLVVRRSPGSRVPPDAVGRALGLPVAAVVPEERALARAAEEGDVPGRPARGRWPRVVARLLVDVRGDGRGR